MLVNEKSNDGEEFDLLFSSTRTISNLAVSFLAKGLISKMSGEQDFGLDETKESGSSKKNNRSYSEDSLKAALELIRNGTLSMNAASKQFSIPWSTLKNRMNNPVPQQVGSNPMLSAEMEKLLTDWLIKCAELGDPRTRDELLSAAGDFVDENNQKIFKNGTPTSSWLQGFMKRNPTVSFRTPSSLSRASANVSPADIVGFIDGVKKYLEEKNLLHLLNDPSAWGNSDETGIDLNPPPMKVLAAKGGRNVYRVETSKPKSRVTVLYTFTADGKMLTPQLIVNESTSTIADISFTCGGK
jgi:hypothetical protein